MAIDALVAPLLRVPLFQGLKPLQLTEIARRADRVVFKPGEVIVGGDRNDAAVLIVSGEAVRQGAKSEGPEGPEDEAAGEEAVPSGALLAEMAMLIEPEEPTSTFVARTTVRALNIRRAEMLEQMTEDPGLARHLADKIADRLQGFVSELREIEGILTASHGEAHAAPELAAAAG